MDVKRFGGITSKICITGSNEEEIANVISFAGEGEINTLWMRYFSKEEVIDIVRNLKNGKSACMDGIINDIFKNEDDIVIVRILKSCNSVCGGLVRKESRRAVILPLCKRKLKEI